MPHSTRPPAASPRFSLLEGAAVLLAAAGLPLVFVPWDYSPYLHVKPAWGLTAAAVVLLAWAWRALTGGAVRVAVSGPNVWGGLFVLWNFALCPVAASRSLAWDRCVWLAGAWTVALAWQQWTRAGGRRRLLAFAHVMAAAAGVTAAWALWQDLYAKGMLPAWLPAPLRTGNLLGDWRGDVTAGFGNTDFIACFLATLYLPLLLFYLTRRRRAGLRGAVLPIVLWLMAAALIVCWSVGANGALILGSVIVLLAGGARLRRTLARRRTRRRLAVWAAGCAVVILWLVVDTPLNPHRTPPSARTQAGQMDEVQRLGDGVALHLPGIFHEAFSSPRWIEGGPTRWVIWLNAFEMIRRHQFAGVGPGCFPYVFPAMRSPFVPATREYMQYQGAYTNAAHNSFLQAWCETGPVGAGLLALAALAAFKALRRAARSRRTLAACAAWGGFGALAVWCLDGQMTFPLELPPLALLFFVLLGLGPVLAELAPKRHRGFAMPPFILQGRWTELTLEMQGMSRVRAVSLSFDLSVGAARALGAVALALALAAAAQVWRPVVADALYLRAHQSRGETRERRQSTADAPHADALYRAALRAWPRHHDCRSEYSQFLVENGRPKEALAELAIVRRRLNSNELYLREADAYMELGESEHAAERLGRLFGGMERAGLWRQAAGYHTALRQPGLAALYKPAGKD